MIAVEKLYVSSQAFQPLFGEIPSTQRALRGLHIWHVHVCSPSRALRHQHFKLHERGPNLRNGSGQGFAKANMPLISVNPWAASAIAEGALMRHDCGAKCFERYRKDLNV
jgi:hypothetical protein